MAKLSIEQLTEFRRAAEDAIQAMNTHFKPFIDVVAHPLNIISLVDMALRPNPPVGEPLVRAWMNSKDGKVISAKKLEKVISRRLYTESNWSDYRTPLYDGCPDLTSEIERLREILKQEAEYCQQYADKFRGVDEARAKRHQERADRLKRAVVCSFKRI